MKNILKGIGYAIYIFFMFILAYITTVFMFWPMVALVMIGCVLFWILLPVLGWVLLGLLLAFILLYVLIGVSKN